MTSEFDGTKFAKRAHDGREIALTATKARLTRLPLRYLQQQAHLTAPTNDLALAKKSIEGAFDVIRRLLDRYGITPQMIAQRCDLGEDEVQDVIDRGNAPLVLLDLEDGVPPHLIAQACANAVHLFREAEWGPTLRYFRPSGLEDPRGVDDLLAVLIGAGEGLEPDQFPIDGLVFPKVRHVHEVEWLYGVLSDVEEQLGLPSGRIRVSYQIETGWGLQNLSQLAITGLDRLSGVILGTVDLAADILLPEIHYRHPLFDWARHQLVTVAGACGIPAIDGMTLNFPIALKDVSPEENRVHVMERMQENFNDARHSIQTGMAGRWVGHPLQLLATLLAFRAQFSQEGLEADVATVKEFSLAMESDLGAVAGRSGELLDVGTDRHLRRKLRLATAWGLLSEDAALELGLISPQEARGRE